MTTLNELEMSVADELPRVWSQVTIQFVTSQKLKLPTGLVHFQYPRVHTALGALHTKAGPGERCRAERYRAERNLLVFTLKPIRLDLD